MRKRPEDASQSDIFLLLTDEKDNSQYWFRDGVQKALDGYASAQMVSREEFEQKVRKGERVIAVIVDTAYTHDWQDYLHQLAELSKGMGIKILIAATAPNVEDSRFALTNGASDYFVAGEGDNLRNDIFGF